MLRLVNIDKVFGQNTPLERVIFKNFNFEIKSGDFKIIKGENGSGKSTLFHIISGGLVPDKGMVFLDEIDVTSWPQTQRAKDIAVVMQDPKIGTIESMTIFENMMLASKRGQSRGFGRFDHKIARKTVQEKLSLLNMGLENRLDALVVNLSGGQRQALSLMMAFMAPSKLILLDEITAALDPEASKRIMQLVDQMIIHEQRTCLMITHSIEQLQQYKKNIVTLDS